LNGFKLSKNGKFLFSPVALGFIFANSPCSCIKSVLSLWIFAPLVYTLSLLCWSDYLFWSECQKLKLCSSLYTQSLSFSRQVSLLQRKIFFHSKLIIHPSSCWSWFWSHARILFLGRNCSGKNIMFPRKGDFCIPRNILPHLLGANCKLKNIFPNFNFET